MVDNFDLLLEQGAPQVAQTLIRTVRRQIRQAAQRESVAQSEYACTLLGVALDSRGRWIAVHLGDGGIVGRLGSEIVAISVPRKGEFANETYFVTDADAVTQLRIFGFGRGDEFRAASHFALFTDGLEGSLLHRRTGRVAEAVQQMFSWFKQYSDAQIAVAIEMNISEIFRQRTSDDCTLVSLRADLPERAVAETEKQKTDQVKERRSRPGKSKKRRKWRRPT